MPKPSLRLWRYSINHGPNGEQNYANVYDETGRLVGNLAIDHAITVVTTKNEVDELRYLQAEVEQGDHLVRKRERERCANLAAAKESNDAGDYTAGWNDACDSIADAIRELADEPS